MKKLILLSFMSFSFLSLQADEDFISHHEYGQMLYENPRGVSCAQCHGKKGKGTIIVEYKDANVTEVLRGKDIRKDSLETMIVSVNSYHKVMPRYYLTDEEVKAIYDYLKLINQEYLAQ